MYLRGWVVTQLGLQYFEHTRQRVFPVFQAYAGLHPINISWWLYLKSASQSLHLPSSSTPNNDAKPVLNFQSALTEREADQMMLSLSQWLQHKSNCDSPFGMSTALHWLHCDTPSRNIRMWIMMCLDMSASPEQLSPLRIGKSVTLQLLQMRLWLFVFQASRLEISLSLIMQPSCLTLCWQSHSFPFSHAWSALLIL